MAVTSMSRSSIGDFTRANSMSGAGLKTFEVTYLVIAGGGGGGQGINSSDRRGGSGGGAGGYRCSVTGENTGGGLSAETPLILAKGTYALTVGAGGTAAGGLGNNGTRGSDSVFADIRSYGGAFGVRDITSGEIGGSGSGAGAHVVALTGDIGLPGQGSAGGNNAPSGAGGSGGAGGAGANATSLTGGAGGAGVSSSVTGSSVGRGGGGGGGGQSTGGSATDGGGTGAGSSTPGTAGTANTGGGGGGGSHLASAENGGSGVVVLSVPTNTTVSFSAGVTQSSAIVGDNTVYTVTATSTTSETVTIG